MLVNGLPYLGVTVQVGTFLTGDGTAAKPAWSFFSDTTKGIYSSGVNQIGISLAGVASLLIGAGGLLTGPTGSTLTLGANITLTPSGTGQILLPSGANATPTLNNAAWGHPNTGLAFGGSDAGAESVQWVYRGTASWAFGATAQTFYHPGAGVITADTSLSFRTNPGGANTHIFLPNSTNNVLLGGLAVDGTGVLQFPAATTSAGGITFGVDVSAYRYAAGRFVLDHVGGTTPFLSIAESGTVKGEFKSNSGNVTVNAVGGTLFLNSNNAITLVLDTSQNAIFKGVATLSNSGSTVAGLPAAATHQGALAFVTDATLTAITGLGLAVVGGGANKVVVYSDGANWLIL